MMNRNVALPLFTLLAILAAASVSPLRAQDAAEWKPVDPPMLTRWAKDIDPNQPLPEYPRPQLTRSDWMNLNGLWQYAITDKQSTRPINWDGQILVPYPVESALSGVKRSLKPEDALYYSRKFEVPSDWSGKRILLHFGAVDYRCQVFVNYKRVGSHEGGYDPFSFDITPYLTGDKEQSLMVKVTDPTYTEGQPRGKQTLSPAGIMYTPTSGIWQTVWLEPVADGGVEDLIIVPDVDGESVKVTVDLYGDSKDTVSVEVKGGESISGAAGEELTVPVKSPRLWSPEDPYLYDMTIQVEQQGKVVDEIGTYFGMRSIKKAEVDGVQRLLLNGKPLFMFGPLDQGFWPDGVYTAPTDEALKYDIEITKKLGFNTTRKHIKVEPARWYYHADRLGLIVWQDMPSANSYDTPPGGRPAVDKDAYETQLKALIDNLENHPAIVMWIVFNESQGKHDTAKLVRIVRDLDPSRLVNEDSGFQGHGGPYRGFGDLFDCHPYPAPRVFDAPEGKAFALGEYGGIGLKMGNNPWQAKGWGYTTTKNSRELEDLYAQFTGMLKKFNEENGLTSAIYTQLTDVEIEINGLLTYDRQLKIDPEWIAKANRFEWDGPKYVPLVADSRTSSVEYTYTFTQPGDEWMQPACDTSSWKTGEGGFGTRETPNIGKLGTKWNTSDIWLRREVDLPELDAEQLSQLVLQIYHDDDVKVYFNGVLAIDKSGFESNYASVSVSDEARQALKPGEKNLVAIHCHQGTGGQYIDFGLGVLDPNRPVSSESASADGKGEQVSKTFTRTAQVEQQLDYLFYLPSDYDANRTEGWPLMLFLHGAGERGSDVSKVKVHGPPKLVANGKDLPCILVSPQCPKGRVWNVDELNGLLDSIMEEYNVDADRVYLTGLSMGGFGTWNLGTSNPERFAALAPICGGGDEIAVMLAADEKKETLRNLPVWAFHGEIDPVVPLEASQKMVDALKKIGSEKVKFTTYPEAAHDSWTQTYDNPEFFKWMFEQKRGK
ncbi:sugar-binding domain-containing protein [Aeoliella mucimassa]|nr:sugar-binding domain-containing protein [Aeoliella mucimassa]